MPTKILAEIENKMKTKYLPRAWQINSKNIYEGNYYKYKKKN